MASQHGADHHHGGTKADAFGNITVFANTAIRNDGLGGNPCTPLQCRQLPAACAKAGFEFGDAHLARANAHLGGICTPGFQIDDGLGGPHIACNHKSGRHFFFQVCNHALHIVRVAMGNVDGDVVGHQAQCQQLRHGVVICLFDAKRDRGKHVFGFAIFHKLHSVQIEAVHHIKIAALGQPFANTFIHYRFHVGRHHRQAKAALA